jgi:hypothetical protein
MSSILDTGAVTSLAQAHSRRGGRTPAGVAHDLIRDHLRFRGVWTQKGTSPKKTSIALEIIGKTSWKIIEIMELGIHWKILEVIP